MSPNGNALRGQMMKMARDGETPILKAARKAKMEPEQNDMTRL